MKTEGRSHAASDHAHDDEHSSDLSSDALNETDSLTLHVAELTNSLTAARDSAEIGLPRADGDSLTLADASALLTDSVAIDTIPVKKGSLETPVDYHAEDSIIWTADNVGLIFGDGDVKYGISNLKSEMMQIDMNNSILYATHGTDSLGDEFGHPILNDGSQEIEAKEMHYNFKTGRAYARLVVTQQGDGIVISDQAKKLDDNVMYMKDGKYTTCDHDHPHFYLNLTKAKARMGKDIITGPAYLVIEDVPLPIALPFVFFPFTDSYSSGIIMPTYGDEMSRGFFLRNGGYYFALSDYIDLSLTGEIYTKGSWGVSGESSYRKRYKYSGKVSLSYLVTVTGDKGLDDYQKRKDFSVRISHTQDPLANPYRTISASVDYSSSSYDRNQLNSLYSPAGTQNNKGSSVSLSQRFPNSPFSLSATMNINQRSSDSSVSVTLPDLNVTMSRIYPLKRKNALGKERFYEKISLNYNAQLRNSISTKEDLLFKSNLIKDWKNAVQHRASVSATYSVLNHINLTPSFDYTERWYTNKINREYQVTHNENGSITRRLTPSDTVYGFNRVYNYSASISASTTLYGMFTPWKPFRKIITKIRHRMDPSVSFSYTPDFGDPKYGFYRYYEHINQANGIPGLLPDTVSGWYSPYEGQIFGVPGRGKSGSIAFTLDNNIEAKVPDDREPSGERKISLIDKLSGSISYNLVADSMNWSDLRTSMRLKLMKNYTLNLNMIFDTYAYEYDETNRRLYLVNKPRWTVGKGIGRLKSTGTSFSYTFNNDTFKKLFSGGGGGEKNKNNNLTDDPADPFDPEGANDPYAQDDDTAQEPTEKKRKSRLGNKTKQNDGEYDYDGYYNVTIPWSLSFNYNLAIAYDTQKINLKKKEYKYKFTHALSFNGDIQPTTNWRVNFNATYDVENKKLSHMTCTISRTMHCFQMSVNIIPIGAYKSYSFSIAASAAMLKDLKYDQSNSPYDNQTWY
jgi:hypothetical protein